MIALIDIDSLLYLASYKLNEPEFIEKCGLQHQDDEIILPILAEIAIDRCNEMLMSILMDIESDENNINITGYEVYLTFCKNSIRKKINSDYKNNRIKNDIVDLMRSLYIFKNEAIYDDEFEADDLIADRARELRSKGENCVIVTMDKDLNQIGGLIYNYYKKPSKYDENGKLIQSFDRKGLSFVGDFEAIKFLATQMLMGDSSDNIMAIKGIGIKTAEKILQSAQTAKQLFFKVVRLYIKHFKEDYIKKLKENYRLLYLGKQTNL